MLMSKNVNNDVSKDSPINSALALRLDYEFLKLDFKRQLDFSLPENIVWDPHIHHSHKTSTAKKDNAR